MNRRTFLTSSAAIGAVTVLPLSLTGCNTSWISTAIKDLPTIQTILTSLAAIALDASGNGLLDPAAQIIIDAAISAAGVGLTATQTAITAYNANPGASTLSDIEAALSAELPKLSDILAAINVKNSALINTITGSVNLAISVIASIQLLLPNSMAAARYRAAGVATPVVTIPTSKEIANQFNLIVVTNGFSKHQIKTHIL
jgi:hypothetical protein